MTNDDYVKLMKKLRPDVIVSDELIALFKAQYPPNSQQLLQLRMMVTVAPLVKRLKGQK